VTALALVLRFLHILSASTWLGAALWTAGDVRRTLAQGQPFVNALAARSRPAMRLDLWAGIATIITGSALVGMRYVDMPRTGIIVGFVAAALRLILLLAVTVPALNRLQAAVASGELAATALPAKRMAMISGIGHLLWVIALAGMVFPF
jgi:hypothetical protein